jgi:hypothetical protein
MLEHAFGFNPSGAVIDFIEMEMMDDNSEGDNDTKLLLAKKTGFAEGERRRASIFVYRVCAADEKG